MSFKEWTTTSSSRDLTPYLKIDQLCEEEGTWILLQGNLRQEDNQARREILAFLQGYIVKSEDSGEIADALKQKKMDERGIPSMPRRLLHLCGRNTVVRYIPNKQLGRVVI